MSRGIGWGGVVCGPMIGCFDLLVQSAYSFVAVPFAATGLEQGAGQRYLASTGWGLALS